MTGSIPEIKPGAGELSPPGLVSHPGGSATVSYQAGATFTAKAASTVVVSKAPLNYGG